MEKTIGILAHVDAGKTTLSEQLLYHTGAIRKRGRVDHGSAFLDFDEIERKRGITIFAEQASFHYNGDTYYLLDTPGHADFAAETERCAAALDYAVLLVSAAEGVQSQTYTLWRILDKLHVPTLFFLNKTDRDGADVTHVLEQIRTELTDRAVLFDKQDELWRESVAVLDDMLLETYMNNGYDDSIFMEAIRKMVKNRQLFPVLSGSALNDIGMDRLLNTLSDITIQEPSDSVLSAYIYKVHYESGKRVCFLKINSGTLRVKDTLPGGAEKINELRRYSGAKWEPIAEASAGSLCAVTGLSAKSGTWIGASFDTPALECIPLLSARVEYPPEKDVKTVLGIFRILEEEEPALSVRFDEALKEIHVRIMGAVQTEILTQLIPDRFGFPVTFGKPNVIYKETLAQPVIGSGHFEPLRHYAEARFLLSPTERGSGISFESHCPTDILAAQYQNLIRTHIFEKTQKGALVGGELTDIKITLIAGRAHLKHTEGGDFRQAVYRAIRQGVCKGESILLEPYYHMEIICAAELTGRVISDIQRMSGTFDGPFVNGEQARLTAYVSVAEAMDYPTQLLQATRGEGRLVCSFAGYDICHNADEIISQAAYLPDRDLENPPDSIFCSHGAGYPVKWTEADAHMHCAIDKSYEKYL